jgi:hypothetical protein
MRLQFFLTKLSPLMFSSFDKVWQQTAVTVGCQRGFAGCASSLLSPLGSALSGILLGPDKKKCAPWVYDMHLRCFKPVVAKVVFEILCDIIAMCTKSGATDFERVRCVRGWPRWDPRPEEGRLSERSEQMTAVIDNILLAHFNDPEHTVQNCVKHRLSPSAKSAADGMQLEEDFCLGVLSGTLSRLSADEIHEFADVRAQGACMFDRRWPAIERHITQSIEGTLQEIARSRNAHGANHGALDGGPLAQQSVLSKAENVEEPSSSEEDEEGKKDVTGLYGEPSQVLPISCPVTPPSAHSEDTSDSDLDLD